MNLQITESRGENTEWRVMKGKGDGLIFACVNVEATYRDQVLFHNITAIVLHLQKQMRSGSSFAAQEEDLWSFCPVSFDDFCVRQ